ncbi:GntR family transcriptional regulator [Primorskyibacter sp. S187A]|uniref:GntR family transcriptional regulator n=1 Tax=Primorskyibacter sp. S187A TaxID=3415130 RepID=UPI003C7D3BE0
MARPTQAQAVIEAVMSRIEEGTLLPGDVVSEADLMAACEVSRTPVREAIIQLEATGLAVRHARKGVRLFQPNTDEFLAILEVHANLEAQAAGLAAQRISPDQLAHLTACGRACAEFAAKTAPRDHAAYYRLNMLFHAAIAEAACNPFLTEMIKLNARKLMAHYRLRYRVDGEIAASAREHAAIVDLIAQGDAAGASAAMLQHFNYDRETVTNMIASVVQRPGGPLKEPRD